MNHSIDMQSIAKSVLGISEPAFMTSAQLHEKSDADAEYERRVETKQKEIMTDPVYVVDYLYE
jgi:hypothetical protein